MKASLLTFVSLLGLAQAQDIPVDLPGFVIPYEGCYQDMLVSDRNGDATVRQDEYLGFIQEYGKRKCWFQDELTLTQRANFNSLACLCRSLEGADDSCCLGDNARLPTAGGANPATRTEAQSQYLATVCRLTDATIPYQCTPSPTTIDTAPPVDQTPLNEEEDDDFPWWWLLLALLLLLLLCCCCCVWRKRRAKELEEEETEEVVTTKVVEEPDVEMAPADGDRDLPLAAGAAAAAIPPESDEDEPYKDEPEPEPEEEPEPDDELEEQTEEVEEEEEEDEDERRRRAGGGNVGDEDDDEARRIRGAGRLPPDEDPDPERVNLKPPPPKDPDDPDQWDQPGRDINFEKPPRPEDEAQTFDPYDPGGGVFIPQHPPREPIEPYKKDWERLKKEEPEEEDNRKHRIQAGLGEGEVFDRLGEGEEPEKESSAPSGDVFDWVVQSALGVLDKNEQGTVEDDSGEEEE